MDCSNCQQKTKCEFELNIAERHVTTCGKLHRNSKSHVDCETYKTKCDELETKHKKPKK